MKTKYKPTADQTKKRTVFGGVMLLLLLAVFTSCTKEEGLKGPDLQNQLVPSKNLMGSLEEVKKYYSVEFTDAMVDIGFELYLGNTPPNLEGSYLISPFILEISTVEEDSAVVGSQFQDYLATFSNQDNANLAIDLDGLQDSQSDGGSGSFITGDGATFTVFSKATTQQGSSEAETAVAISGILSPNGILNIQFFGAMLDDNGDPESVFIENNTGRLLVDGDNFSPKQNSVSKSSIQNGLPTWVKGLE